MRMQIGIHAYILSTYWVSLFWNREQLLQCMHDQPICFSLCLGSWEHIACPSHGFGVPDRKFHPIGQSSNERIDLSLYFMTRTYRIEREVGIETILDT